MYVLWMLVALVGISSTVMAVRGDAASPDIAFPLYKMHEVLGQTVTTRQGKEVGRIENIVLDAATGDLLYCVVTSESVLGVGGTLRALPWEVVQGAADRKSFQLQLEEEQFQNAPQFDKDSWPDMLDRHWVDAIHVYYGKPPRLGKHLPPETNEPVAQGPRPVLMAASLLGSQVISPRGQRLGTIEDIVIESTAGQVAYVVLAMGGLSQRQAKWLALPWQELQQSKGLGTFVLTVDDKVLEETPGFDRARWPTQAQRLSGAGK